MWVHEHVGETTVGREAVWRVLRNLDEWEQWDTSMESVRLDGPFGVGAKVVMKPRGQDPVISTIVEAVENEIYADETEFGDVTLRFCHQLMAQENGGTKVIHRLEITGPAADTLGPELGPMITEDFPQAMEALFRKAAA